MKENRSIKSNLKGKHRRSHGTLIGGGLKLLLSVLIVTGAVAIYRHQINTSPRAGRMKPPRQAKLVQVIPVLKEGCTTTVKGNGLVMPAQQVTLHPQVIGKIVEVSGCRTRRLCSCGTKAYGHRPSGLRNSGQAAAK
jgi:hypothetical protein